MKTLGSGNWQSIVGKKEEHFQGSGEGKSEDGSWTTERVMGLYLSRSEDSGRAFFKIKRIEHLMRSRQLVKDLKLN